MDAVSVGILIVCVTAAAALVALCRFLACATKTVTAAKDTIEAKVNPILDEAYDVLTGVPPTLNGLPGLVSAATETVTCANEVIGEVEVVTKKVAHVAEKASEIAHVPVEFAHSVAAAVKGSPEERRVKRKAGRCGFFSPFFRIKMPRKAYSSSSSPIASFRTSMTSFITSSFSVQNHGSSISSKRSRM